MHDGIELPVTEELLDVLEVALDELDAAHEVGQTLAIAEGHVVDARDGGIGRPGQDGASQARSDEAGDTGDEVVHA